MTDQVNRTETDAAADLARESAEATEIVFSEDMHERGGAIVVPKGATLVSLQSMLAPYKQRPDRVVGTAQMETAQAFIDHIKRHKAESTTLWAVSPDGHYAMIAVYDGHAHSDGGKLGLPGWGQHRARYDLTPSDEWRTWHSIHDKVLSQEQFAMFLEDNSVDLATVDGPIPAALAEEMGAPLAPPSKIIALARGLSIKVENTVETFVTLESGEGQINWSESHTDKGGGKVNVPRAFLIALPAVPGGEPYAIGCRLRYKVKDKKVTWTVHLHNTRKVFDEVFLHTIESVNKATGIAVLRGTPE